MQQIGILGSGAMGAGIAQVAATAGCEVVIFDAFEGALIKGCNLIEANLNRLVERKKMDDVTAKIIFGRIKFCDNLDAFTDCELVIEAIVEDLELKKSSFQQLESVVNHDCILASNTSSLSLTAIAAACKNPNRVVGIHFFNPAPIMELVEIIPAIQTNKLIVTKVKNVIQNWGKIVVEARDTPGFLVNRIARPFYGEAMRILEEDIADCATIDWAMMEFGNFKMGPFALMDFIGHDVNYRVTDSVFSAFYFDPRYRPSLTQKSLLDAGWLGKKSGKGFYNYADNVTKIEPNKNSEIGKKIFLRILSMLINEAADALFLKIATAEDIELAMQKGTNYPKGLLRWADELGLPNCVELLDNQYIEYGEDRYRCSPLLRRMAKENKTFFPQNV